MILERICLTNFRCFETLCVPLDRHLNVFIGGNGAGKTSILDGVASRWHRYSLGFPLEAKGTGRSLRSSDIRRTSDDRSASFLRINVDAMVDGSRRIGWGLTQFRDKSSTTRKEAPPGGKHLAQLHDYVDRIIDAHNENRPFTLPVFAIYGTTRAADSRKHQHRALGKKGPPSRFAALEAALEPKVDFRDAVEWFDIFEQRELRDQRDRSHSEPLPALDAVRRAVGLMIPEVSNPRIDATTNRFVVDTTDSTGTLITLQLDQLSDGYQVMLGVVMDFALRLAMANPPGTQDEDVLASEGILCIDEVDLHLHPSWQQRVIPDLRRTFSNTQLILTTHSPQVATTVPSRNLRILKGSQLFSAPAGTEGRKPSVSWKTRSSSSHARACVPPRNSRSISGWLTRGSGTPPSDRPPAPTGRMESRGGAATSGG